MRVALYARVSSESQEARGTIGSQLEVLRARIAAEGHELVGEFCDDGCSGARLDRPALDAMRDQAEAGAFEAVWCLSPDRLARAYVYQVLVLDELSQFGVQVLFNDAPAIDDDPQLRLLTQVQGVIAEYERAKIAERNRRGRLYRSRAGEVVSWKAPYGYRRVARDASGPARLEVFEPEAAVVRRIFDDYLGGGHSIRQIVRRLNTDDILTPTGKSEWWHSTVCRVLRNEAYVGRVYFNQTETVATTSRNGRRSTTQRRRPREDWIAVPCPPIIADGVFDAAQAVSRDNSKWSPRNLPEDVEAWLLRRLVRCGPCGATVGCQKMVTRGGKVHRYYWCPNHARTRAGGEQRCPERNIRADALDTFVFEQVRDALLRPDVLLAAQTAVAAAAPVPDDELLTVELARIDRKLDANRAERRRLADLYQSGLLELADVQRRARDVDARHRSLSEQRDGLLAQRHELATDNQLRQRVSNFAQRAAAGIDNLTFSARQQLLRLVVEHVRVTGWQVEVQLRIPLDDDQEGPHGGGNPRPPDSGGGGEGGGSGPHRRLGAGPVSSKDGLRSLRGARRLLVSVRRPRADGHRRQAIRSLRSTNDNRCVMRAPQIAFDQLVQDFFLRRLINQRGVSPRTVESYRDAFELLFGYIEQRLGKHPSALTLADLDAPVIVDFLEHLETVRHNSARTRNARLAAIHSFMRYAALRDPASLPITTRVLAVPSKRFDRPVLGHLSQEQVAAILKAPDRTCWTGQRDAVLFAVAYNTGARVSELTDLKIRDVLVDRQAVQLHGKGRKERVIPLWANTAAELRAWLTRLDAEPEAPVFPNRAGTAMTRSGVRDRLDRAVTKAQRTCPSLEGQHVSPHTIRHSTAVHLLQAGVDLAVIALWLGHSSPAVTHQYLEADLATKEATLSRLRDQSPEPARLRPPDRLLAFLEQL